MLIIIQSFSELWFWLDHYPRDRTPAWYGSRLCWDGLNSVEDRSGWQKVQRVHGLQRDHRPVVQVQQCRHEKVPQLSQEELPDA